MTALRKFGELKEADIDDEIVIMRLDNGSFYSLAGTGAAVWRLIDGQRDRDALIIAARREFTGNDTEIAMDIDELLTQLKAAGLLETA